MRKYSKNFIYTCLLAAAVLLLGQPATAQDIWDAVNKGEIQQVKKLLIENPELVKQRDNKSGFTPLHEAAANGQIDICKLLIEQGADVRAADNSRSTPLHVASFNGRVAVVNLLLDEGADANQPGRDGGTSLHMAAWGGHPELIRVLVKRGVDVSAEDNNGYTPLVWAAVGKTTEALDELIKQGADPYPRIRIGRSILHLAAGSGNAAVIEYLLDKGLDVDAKSDYGNTPLFWATRNKNYEVVEILVARGADLRVINNSGHTPVSFAVSINETGVLELFSEKGINIGKQDETGDTYLHAAAYHGFQEMATLLRDRGVNLNKKNNRGLTALDLAIKRDHAEIQRLLVASGAERGGREVINTAGLSKIEQPGHGMEAPLKITIIYDNYMYKEGVEAGFGFACYIEGPEKNILFDTGTNPDLFDRNLKELGVDPSEVDLVVISHEHGDHIGGLFAFLEKNRDVSVIVPYSASYTFIRKIEACGAKVVTVKDAVEICKNVYVGGEMGGGIKEQSLAINTTKGLVVVCGCAHPGIVDIAENFKKIADRDIYMVLGGFHLIEKTEQETKSIIDRMKGLGIQKCGPTHCTGERQIQIFKEGFGDDHVKTGVGRVIVIQ